jgi:hypothetical protein
MRPPLEAECRRRENGLKGIFKIKIFDLSSQQILNH